ncbi:MAG: hypothetical protein M3N52_06490, partial [Actinomycetota bacterium]|nr:hypothetical protein [Actinomycetota bacterium]
MRAKHWRTSTVRIAGYTVDPGGRLAGLLVTPDSAPGAIVARVEHQQEPQADRLHRRPDRLALVQQPLVAQLGKIQGLVRETEPPRRVRPG